MAKTKYPNIIAEIFRFVREAIMRRWCGWSAFSRYVLAVLAAAYSMLMVLYDFDIVFMDVIQVPFSHLYRDVVIPFLVSPLIWVGLSISPSYKSFVALSGVGGAIWANSEFRNNQFLILYPFPKLQCRPGSFDRNIDWSKPPEPKPLPTFFSLKSLLRYLEILFLTYSLIGLICSVAGVLAGIRIITKTIKQMILILYRSLLYVLQRVLVPIERFGDDDYWGTKLFLGVYNHRARIDKAINLTEPKIYVSGDSVIKEIARDILTSTGRVFSAAMLVIFAFAFFSLTF